MKTFDLIILNKLGENFKSVNKGTFKFMSINMNALLNSLSLSLKNSQENFELNDINLKERYLPYKSNKYIYDSCYKCYSNIKEFNLTLGINDPYLLKYGIISKIKLTKTEYLELTNLILKNKDLRKALDNYLNEALWNRNKVPLFPILREEINNKFFAISKKLSFKFKKHGSFYYMNGFDLLHNWCEITLRDFVSHMESEGFKHFILTSCKQAKADIKLFLTKDLSVKIINNYNETNELEYALENEVKTHEKLLNNCIENNTYYWDRFHFALNFNPYIWLSALNSWMPDYIFMEDYLIL